MDNIKKNKLKILRNQLSLHFNQRTVVEDRFKVSAFKHYTIWRSLILFLRGRGFIVSHDKEILKNYPILNNTRRYAIKGFLECKLKISPIGFELSFFQNINIENKNGGEYDFDKYSKMPYLIRLSFLNEINHLVEYFEDKWHCEIEFCDDSTNAVDRIIHHFQTSSFDRKNIKALDQIAPAMSTYDLASNNNDRDKKKITCGEVKYYRHYKGGLRRGVVYHNINNMWWFIESKNVLNNVASFDLFDPTEKDFQYRRLKEHRPPKVFLEKMKVVETLSVKQLKAQLKRKLAV